MFRKIHILFALIFVIQVVNAATLHGTIYDLSLEKTSNVIIEINSSPKQRYVSKEGSYSFNLPPGSYKLTARQIESNITLSSTEDFINVIDDGDYVLDLFLFTNFEEEESLYIDDIEIIDYKTTNYLLIVLIIVLLCIAGIILYYFTKRKVVIHGDEDLNKIFAFIKSQGGRTTQKEIRKQTPLSEAKVSLIISELEAKGVVQKIKKGRGNIIILKRD